MPLEKPPESNIVNLRLICDNQPAGQAVEAVLRGQSRRGLLLELDSPFIANQHIMMSTPYGAACRLEVTFPNSEQSPKMAEVIRFDREKEEDSAKAWFVVELAYVNLETDKSNSKIWAPFRRKAGQIIRGGEDF